MGSEKKTELVRQMIRAKKRKVMLSLYRAGHTFIVTGVRGTQNF